MEVGNTAAAATAPTGANTVVLFDSFVVLLGTPISTYEIERYVARITNDQAGTLLIEISRDGTNTDTIQSTAVGIPAGPLEVSTIDVPVDGARHFKASWVNGGVNQGAGWRLTQELVLRDRAALT